MQRQDQRAWAERGTQAGFTLLELMVTMMVSSLVVLAAYQLFASTSEAMYEANSLSDTTDRARFGLEMMARDVRAAGSFGSPESRDDTFVNENQLMMRNVRGVYAISNHQAQRLGDVQNVWNRATRSDEIILLGAYDFPFRFEIMFPTGGANFNEAIALNTERGALRFMKIDPFITADQPGFGLSPGIEAAVTEHITSRVMRVLDRNGFAQFVAIDAAAYAPGDGNGLSFDLDPGTARLQARPSEEETKTNPALNARAGLEPGGDDDVGYSAALLDAYRYRVCAMPNLPNRLRLVRERLNARRLIENEPPPTDALCVGGAVTVGPGNYVLEQSLVVDGVADFQVWYDCVLPGTPTMESSPWATGWMAPESTAGSEHSCIYVDSSGTPVGAASPGLVRMAHLRLSVHTSNERSDVPNYGFFRADGSTVNDVATTDPNNLVNKTAAPTTGDLPGGTIGSLQTFDLDGDVATAARVVTMQVDVQLTNYVNRAMLMRAEEVNDDTFRR